MIPPGDGPGATARDGAAVALAAVARAAAALVPEGAQVGLGTGRAAAAFVAALGELRRQGLVVTGVPTSEAAAAEARAAGIPLSSLQEGRVLDLTVDGADEVTADLDVLKGGGGALVRERIVAAASARQVILIGTEKLVGGLGQRFAVPIEIIPMAAPLVARRMKAMGLRPRLRPAAEGGGGGGGGEQAAPFVTENGNLILDCSLAAPLAGPTAARQFEQALRSIPGVVDTGLFLGTCERVLIGHPDGRVDVLLRDPSHAGGGASGGASGGGA